MQDQDQQSKSNSSLGPKVPPSSIEAEQSVIGGLLLNNAAWDDIADRVGSQDFYREDHKKIFDAIGNLADQNKPFDLVTLSEYLEGKNNLQEVGGMTYLGTLAKNTPSASNIAAYADIVRERSVLRQLIQIGNEIADKGFYPNGRSSKEILDDVEQIVFKIGEQNLRQSKSGHYIKDILKKVVEHITHLHELDNPITGIPTGFNDFDEMTSGLQKSDFIVIAGRPSMGKTTFAMNIAENAAIKYKHAVAVFSLEMPAEQLTMRMMSSLGRIDQHKVRTGKLHDEDWPRLTSAMEILSQAPIYIDDAPGLTPVELRARARRLKKEVDLQLIVIDYLQLMQVHGAKENRTGEISEISRSLKSLARELNVPIIALSQLNRGLEQRPNKRPIMSDLRESGAIEQDADLIVFIYRDEVYNEDTTNKNMAEIIIGKQRNGPIGKVDMTFLGRYTRFENYMQEIYEEASA